MNIVNSAAVNIGVHVSFRTMFSLDICPGVGLLDHVVALFLVNMRLSECTVSYYSALSQVSAKIVGSSYPAVPGSFHLAMPDFYFILVL